MNSTSQQQKVDFVECEICLEEIPISEAKSEEASDYVAHYFGMECYAIWKEQQHEYYKHVI